MLSNHLLLFFDISGGELLVIMVVVFLVFGPKKMPEIARKLGRVINEVKKATSDITREFKEETDGIKNEFLSARDGIKSETDKLDLQMSLTKARVDDQLKQVNEEIGSSPSSADPAIPTPKPPIPAPEIPIPAPEIPTPGPAIHIPTPIIPAPIPEIPIPTPEIHKVQENDSGK